LEGRLEGEVRFKWGLAKSAMFDIVQREKLMTTLEFEQLDVEGGGSQEGVRGYGRYFWEWCKLMMQTYGTAMPVAQALAEMRAMTYEKAARIYAKNNERALLPISTWADMWNQEHLKRGLDPIGEDHEPLKTHEFIQTLPMDMRDHLYSVENLMGEDLEFRKMIKFLEIDRTIALRKKYDHQEAIQRSRARSGGKPLFQAPPPRTWPSRANAMLSGNGDQSVSGKVCFECGGPWERNNH